MSKKFCTCRPRLSGYDNSSACVAMWFKLRRLGAYKVKESGGMPQYEAGSDGKCFSIRQGVRKRIRFGTLYLLFVVQLRIIYPPNVRSRTDTHLSSSRGPLVYHQRISLDFYTGLCRGFLPTLPDS